MARVGAGGGKAGCQRKHQLATGRPVFPSIRHVIVGRIRSGAALPMSIVANPIRLVSDWRASLADCHLRECRGHFCEAACWRASALAAGTL